MNTRSTARTRTSKKKNDSPQPQRMLPPQRPVKKRSSARARQRRRPPPSASSFHYPPRLLQPPSPTRGGAAAAQREEDGDQPCEARKKRTNLACRVAGRRCGDAGRSRRSPLRRCGPDAAVHRSAAKSVSLQAFSLLP